MPNPYAQQKESMQIASELFGKLPIEAGAIPAMSQIEFQILEALKRIEAKLSPAQSAILTGPEVERVFTALAKHGVSK